MPFGSISLPAILLGTAGSLVLAGGLAASAATPPPRLVMPGGHSSGGSLGAAILPDVSGGVPYFLAGPVVCLDRPGRAKIERATVFPPGELSIRAVAVRSNLMAIGRGGIGAGQLTLAAAGYPPAGKTVEAACPSGVVPSGPEGVARSMQVGLEFVKKTDDTATAEAVVIEYSVNGRRHHLRWPFAVTLCRPGLKDYFTQCPEHVP